MTTDKAMVTELRRIISDNWCGSYWRAVNYQQAEEVRASLTLDRGEAEPVVKPLEWEGGPHEFTAVTIIGTYCMDRSHGKARFYALDRSSYQWLDTCDEAKAAAQSDYETRILSTLSKRGEAEERPAKKQSDAILELLDPPAPVHDMVGPDRATVARDMKDFEEFVAKTAPKLHWTVHQDGSADPSRHNGYYDGWQHGFGEALFGPLPLDRLMVEMKTSVIAKVRARTATTEGSDNG